MIIKEVLAELETKNNPVAKSLHKGSHFNVLILGFKKGMVLKEHKAGLPSKLTVLEGRIIYTIQDRNIELSKFDTIDIPVSEVHAVEALEDAICLLSQG